MSRSSWDCDSLIVGADSMIGAALVKSLKVSGQRVFGTTRRKDETSEARLLLNLADIDPAWVAPRAQVAYLVAAVARIEDCRKDPDGARIVNVEAVRTLVDQFTRQGTFIVYVSTNQVFDGSRPHPLIDAKRSPITEYGRQKAETEKIVEAAGDKAAIVRLTKVFGERVPLFEKWAEELKSGREITPFSDMMLAPVSLSDVVTVLQDVGEKRRAGIFHVSGEKDFSYAEVSGILAEQIGADKNLVRPITTAEVDFIDEPQPRYTALGNPENSGKALRWADYASF